jgi:hypothetical protein
MDNRNRKEKTKEHQENTYQTGKTTKLQSVASAFHIPNYGIKNSHTSTFQLPEMLKTPQEQVPKCKPTETHKSFILPSIQQSYQRPQQSIPRSPASSVTSIQSTLNKQSLPILHTGVNLPSVCNRSIKRPISISNSSESSSDRSVTDNSNRSTAVPSVPMEVTVSSRIEVKTRMPDNLSSSSVKNV